MSAAARCSKLTADLQDKRDLIKVSQLIDLTDKPIGLARHEISSSTVRSVASNCICCCCSNSITLVTTDNSYILDHVPLDNIKLAQTNPSLHHLALSNEHKIAIIHLLEGDIQLPSGRQAGKKQSAASLKTANDTNNNRSYPNHDKAGHAHHSHGLAAEARAETMIVNLAAEGLSASDVIFWRWLDDSTLAILSREYLFTCSLDQQHIGHPAMSALPDNRLRLLGLERVVELHHRLSDSCQVIDIQRDPSGNLYAISGSYTNAQPSTSVSQAAQQPRPRGGLTALGAGDEWLGLKYYKSQAPSSQRLQANESQTRGLVQVYCRLRQRSQLIQAHAVAFTSAMSPVDRLRLTRRRFSAQIGLGGSSRQQDPPAPPSLRGQQEEASQRMPTILVAANKIGRQMRVYFVEMARDRHGPSNGRCVSPVTSFNRLANLDFPTSIICSQVTDAANPMPLHVAMITTKHGQLFVCSVTHSTILFSTTITNDIISSTILETTTKGLMAICRGGKVLLVRVNLSRLMSLMEENKSLRHISSSHNILSSMSQAKQKITSCLRRSSSSQQLSAIQATNPIEIGLDIIMSTKL